MKRIQFLHNLYLEEKIKVVEASSEVKDSYLEKSSKSLSSAKILLEAGNLEDSVSMAYYSMYHCLLALLFRVGVKCENHAASIILLKELFGIDNDDISQAKKERVDKQYYVDFSVTKEEVKVSIAAAESFNAKLRDFIDRLSISSVKGYVEKAKVLIGVKDAPDPELNPE